MMIENKRARICFISMVLLAVVGASNVFGAEQHANEFLTGGVSPWTRTEIPIWDDDQADLKMLIDHADDDDFSATLEFQFGKMFTPRIGVYGERFIGDEVLDTNAYDWGLGLGFRFMY